MKSTDAFKLSPSSEEYKQSIIDKIEDNLEIVKNQLDSPITGKERVRFIGKHDALERLKIQINGIRENSVHLVDPSSPTIGTPQFLTTDNKFLNAAYWQAMNIRNTRSNLGSGNAASPEGEIGKRIVMSEIMTYIKYL